MFLIQTNFILSPELCGLNCREQDGNNKSGNDLKLPRAFSKVVWINGKLCGADRKPSHIQKQPEALGHMDSRRANKSEKRCHEKACEDDKDDVDET